MQSLTFWGSVVEKIPLFWPRQERCSTILPRKCAWTQRNGLVQSRRTLQLDQLEDSPGGQTTLGGSQQACNGPPQARTEAHQVSSNFRFSTRSNLSVVVVAQLRLRVCGRLPRRSSIRCAICSKRYRPVRTRSCTACCVGMCTLGRSTTRATCCSTRRSSTW